MAKEYVSKDEAIKLLPSRWKSMSEVMEGILIECTRCKRMFVVVNDKDVVIGVCPYQGCEARVVHTCVRYSVKVIK